ncbi:MAG: ribonuclease HI [Gammaproteobacteria bacterium]|nr:ribonuclease HI [Gammaproteobacteria bacterium]|tara:strand:- start:527 stop:976 length:450 start_codon:yes stop_codon:yes gene_type:complete
MKNNVVIYTDGACKGNPGEGGWGAVIEFEESTKKLYGYENNTTNNRMEITAAINAIKSLKIKSNVVIHTDSKYLMNGINDWINNWKNNNWKTSTKKDVKNVDLWKAIDDLSSEHTIKWNWVKGHSGNPGNEMADDLANLAILKKSEKLE